MSKFIRLIFTHLTHSEIRTGLQRSLWKHANNVRTVDNEHLLEFPVHGSKLMMEMRCLLYFSHLSVAFYYPIIVMQLYKPDKLTHKRSPIHSNNILRRYTYENCIIESERSTIQD